MRQRSSTGYRSARLGYATAHLSPVARTRPLAEGGPDGGRRRKPQRCRLGGDSAPAAEVPPAAAARRLRGSRGVASSGGTTRAAGGRQGGALASAGTAGTGGSDATGGHPQRRGRRLEPRAAHPAAPAGRSNATGGASAAPGPERVGRGRRRWRFWRRDGCARPRWQPAGLLSKPPVARQPVASGR